MKIVKTKHALGLELSAVRAQEARIVLVPTMGALHAGHLELVVRAKKLGELVVCSVFVNPTQFNDPKDLEKYPRPIESDIRLLESVGCDVLFLPTVPEMYGNEERWSLDLGHLDEILEGQHRPGHFQGVTQIVYKLLMAVRPDMAIFGQKDLQQFLVVQRLVELKKLPVTLVMAPIVREADGLAMSSRNVRLSPKGRQQARVLFATLKAVRDELENATTIDGETLRSLTRFAEDRLRTAPGVTLEYFAICDRDTLLDASSGARADRLVALVAAWVDGVRLIDNLLLG